MGVRRVRLHWRPDCAGLVPPGVGAEPGRKPAREIPAREPARPRFDTEGRGDLLARLSRSSRSLRGVPREAHSHDPAGALLAAPLLAYFALVLLEASGRRASSLAVDLWVGS